MVAWDPIIGSGVAFALMIYALSLRERSEVALNCAVYAFFSLVAGVAAAILLNATEFGFQPRGEILGRVIFSSFALAIAGAAAMSYAYPFATAKPGRLATILYPLGILFAALTLFTPWVVSEAFVRPVENVPDQLAPWLRFGPLAWPFAVFAALCHVAVLRNEWRAWRGTKSTVNRRRARALFFGFLLPGILTVVLAVLLPLTPKGQPLEAPFTALFFVIPLFGVGYALARFRLFDTELFLRENVVTIFAFFLAGYIVVLLLAALMYTVPGAPLSLFLVGALGLFALVGAGYQTLRGVSAWVVDKLAPAQKWVEFQPMEAYLVKRDSGVLVGHAAREGSQGPDQDIVGSMLSAIQEFVQSSFGSAEPLREMHLGKRRMLIEYGELLYLAMVYDGRVSQEVREEIAAGVVQMEKEHGEVLKLWKGRESDVEPLKLALKKVMEGAYAKAQLPRMRLPGTGGESVKESASP